MYKPAIIALIVTAGILAAAAGYWKFGPGRDAPSTQPAVVVAVPGNASLAEDSRLAHERMGQVALAEVKILMARTDFESAADLAARAMHEYVDTTSGPELAALAVQAEKDLVAQRDARAAAARQHLTEQQKADRRARFLRYRDEGVACFNQKQFQAAIIALQNALKEEDDADARTLLDESIARITKPRLAVADFAVAGDVGVADAGRIVGELLLTRFDSDHYQLVERSSLASILADQNLTIAQVVSVPDLLKGRKLTGVRYIVMGTVSRLGRLTVSARMVEVPSGLIVSTAEAQASDLETLQDLLGEMAKLLEMPPEQRQQYLLERQAHQAALTRETNEVVRRQELAAEAERLRLQREREEQEARQRWQHQQDGLAALNNLRQLLAQGNYDQVLWVGRQAINDFGDLGVVRDIIGCVAEAERQLAYLNDPWFLAHARHDQADARNEKARRHEEYVHCLAEAEQHAHADQWAEAVKDYEKAYRLEPTAEVREALADARRKAHAAEDRQRPDPTPTSRPLPIPPTPGPVPGARPVPTQPKPEPKPVAEDPAKAAKRKASDQALSAAKAALDKGDAKSAALQAQRALTLFPDNRDAKDFLDKMAKDAKPGSAPAPDTGDNTPRSRDPRAGTTPPQASGGTPAGPRGPAGPTGPRGPRGPTGTTDPGDE